MIDTDKYEGHTSDWKWIDINEQDNFYLHSEHGDIINHDTPDGKLAQDAPLLLAELKRVLKVMSKIGCSLCDECGLSIEEHIRYHTENDVIAGCPFGED
tara:strand:+ start:344 stop:640 length:297 start_codon:yes stop_codon:yes gene_type:complete